MPNPNYIQEINQFYDWLETNQIPKSAIALWHGLMHIANKAGWEQTFTVAISTIESKTGFKRSELFEARNILSQKGRISWRQRGGNLCAEYEIIFFSVHNTDTKSNTKANTKPTQKPTINKTKLKETKINNSSSPEGDAPEKKLIEHWQFLVDSWFKFFGEKFKNDEGLPKKPLFKGQQAKELKEICLGLKSLTSKEWTSDYAVHCLVKFLNQAFNDKWLSEHFELKNLLQNFNSITNGKSSSLHSQATSASGKQTGANILTAKLAANLGSIATG
jgi:hypothetical protein